MKKIIDLSSHNKIPTDWSAVKYSVDGIIIRCGYRGYGKAGTLVRDKKFDIFKEACEKFNIPYGVYFFPTSISVAEAIEEADFTAELVKGCNLAFPIFADSETAETVFKSGRSDRLNKEDRTRFLIAYLDRLRDYGYEGGVYASTSWFKDRLEDAKLIKYPHWVAQYSSKCTYPYDKMLWQYTSKGSISGMPGRVDISEYYESNTIRIALPVLRRGSVGTEVRCLQDNLCRCGYVVDVDGRFGPNSEANLISWQIANDLVGDGIYGPKSYAKMKELIQV